VTEDRNCPVTGAFISRTWSWRSPSTVTEDRNHRSSRGLTFHDAWRLPSTVTEDRNTSTAGDDDIGDVYWRSPSTVTEDRNTMSRNAPAIDLDAFRVDQDAALDHDTGSIYER
jgi:hypothetical protein